MSFDQFFNLVEGAFYHISNFYTLWLFYIGAIILSLHYFVQRRWLKSIFFFGLALLWSRVMIVFLQYFGGLGTDSFHEVHNFDLKEAFFWLGTFLNIFTNSAFSLKILFLYSLIAVFLFGFISILHVLFDARFEKHSSFSVLIGFSLILAGLYLPTYKSVTMFYENSDSFNQIASNFSNDVQINHTKPKLNVFLYIGESTSSMNMGIYDYPRQTTPQLQRLENENGFIKFDNVFSTHTHTSPSLLEALSLGLDYSDNFKPIHERQRMSIVDVLNKAKIPTQLLSNQGSTGTFNQASSIIFKNANKKYSEPSSRALGNSDSIIAKPWDHDFLNSVVDIKSLNKSNVSLKVFHSYAGHGPYIDNIPVEFRGPVDEYFKQFDPRAITGSLQSLNQVERYDSTISYVDFSVSNGIELINGSSAPWVFIYFSDHGESVFSKRGHDSSRFIHEMARVPFIMFFNAAARDIAPALFESYLKLAKTNNVATLAQLPSTILDLFDVSIMLDTLPTIGTPTTPLPIIVKETTEGVTAVNLSNSMLIDVIDKTDSTTSHFANSKRNVNHHPLICYHRSNTIAKALRGSMATDCLEIDVVVDGVGDVLAFHPPKENNTGLRLEKLLLSVTNRKSLSFWFDGKNLTTEKNCYSLEAVLRSSDLIKSQILIEFPTDSLAQSKLLVSCVKSLRNLGNVYMSYYVSTPDAVSCSRLLMKGYKFDAVNPCRNLEKDLLEVERSGLFSDLSFDFNGIKAIEWLSLSSKFEWNTWNVELSDLDSIDGNRFRMVILKNDDPNNI